MALGASGERPIRVLIAKPGLDGHDVGAKLVCRALREAGMEVIYTGLRQSPAAIAAAVERERVDVVGLSIMSGAHLSLCRRVGEELQGAGLLDRVLWIVGGHIPDDDIEAIQALGVAAVFPIGSPFEAIADFIQGQRVP